MRLTDSDKNNYWVTFYSDVPIIFAEQTDDISYPIYSSGVLQYKIRERALDGKGWVMNLIPVVPEIRVSIGIITIKPL